MAKILDKKKLSPVVYELEIDAPLIARKCKPGQFVIVLSDPESERVPFTIADFDRKKGTIIMVIQVVGNTSRHLCEDFEVGDEWDNIVGPLGQPSEMKNFGTVVCIGGGVGVAPVYPITRAYKEQGNKVISIIGGRNKDLVMWEDRMRAASDELIVCTDDGSYGKKGFVTDPLKEMLERGEKIDYVIAIGPVVMMKNVARTTEPYHVRTVVSLNTIMVDGTGMCGGCRVLVGGENKFACVDGPEFDAHKVNFDNLLERQIMYKDQESVEWSCGGACKCLK